jgi:tRNA(Ile)-lysidine synthase
MTEVANRVRRTIERYRLMTPETQVLVALSGGSDSVALADLLCGLDAKRELRVVSLAHFNHRLRSSADDDERFCRQLAGKLGRPFVSESEDVAARARNEKRSLEDAARRARHEFLERARQRTGADVIALGHTRDDQAETYLLRMLRGAGQRGLASMHPKNGRLVRPLIECRRAELRDYLDAKQLAYVHDESNDDVSIPRNRVRAELLPLIEQRFNPGIVDALADQADIAREEWVWMAEASQHVTAAVRCPQPGEWRIEVDALAKEPLALQRFVVHRLMTQAAGGHTVSFRHVRAVLDLIRHDGGALAMPRHRVQRVRKDLVLTSTEQLKHPEHPEHPEHLELPIPGEIALAGNRLLSAESADSADKQEGGLVGRGPVAMVRGDLCGAGLRVRRRRPGDRFRPLGLGGVKKLQDFFVDRKVPAAERDYVPLVVDAGDNIVWVAGYAVDDRFRVTDPAQAVIILRLKVLGGSA